MTLILSAIKRVYLTRRRLVLLNQTISNHSCHGRTSSWNPPCSSTTENFDCAPHKIGIGDHVVRRPKNLDFTGKHVNKNGEMQAKKIIQIITKTYLIKRNLRHRLFEKNCLFVSLKTFSSQSILSLQRTQTPVSWYAWIKWVYLYRYAFVRLADATWELNDLASEAPYENLQRIYLKFLNVHLWKYFISCCKSAKGKDIKFKQLSCYLLNTLVKTISNAIYIKLDKIQILFQTQVPSVSKGQTSRRKKDLTHETFACAAFGFELQGPRLDWNIPFWYWSPALGLAQSQGKNNLQAKEECANNSCPHCCRRQKHQFGASCPTRFVPVPEAQDDEQLAPNMCPSIRNGSFGNLEILHSNLVVSEQRLDVYKWIASNQRKCEANYFDIPLLIFLNGVIRPPVSTLVDTNGKNLAQAHLRSKELCYTAQYLFNHSGRAGESPEAGVGARLRPRSWNSSKKQIKEVNATKKNKDAPRTKCMMRLQHMQAKWSDMDKDSGRVGELEQPTLLKLSHCHITQAAQAKQHHLTKDARRANAQAHLSIHVGLQIPKWQIESAAYRRRIVFLKRMNTLGSLLDFSGGNRHNLQNIQNYLGLRRTIRPIWKRPSASVPKAKNASLRQWFVSASSATEASIQTADAMQEKIFAADNSSFAGIPLLFHSLRNRATCTSLAFAKRLWRAGSPRLAGPQDKDFVYKREKKVKRSRIANLAFGQFAEEGAQPARGAGVRAGISQSTTATKKIASETRKSKTHVEFSSSTTAQGALWVIKALSWDLTYSNIYSPFFIKSTQSPKIQNTDDARIGLRELLSITSNTINKRKIQSFVKSKCRRQNASQISTWVPVTKSYLHNNYALQLSRQIARYDNKTASNALGSSNTHGAQAGTKNVVGTEIILKYCFCKSDNAFLFVQNLSKYIISYLKKHKASKNKAQQLKKIAYQMLLSIYTKNKHKFKGIGFCFSGRVYGAKKAASFNMLFGSVPLSTLSAKIDYAQITQKTINGT